MKIKNGKLGDVIATLYALENTGRQTGKCFSIEVPLKYFEVLELFDLKYIKLIDNSKISIVDILKSLNPPSCDETTGRFHGHFTYINMLEYYLTCEYGYDSLLAYALLTLVEPHSERIEYYVQFDGKTAFEQHRCLTKSEMQTILKDKNWACLGGMDTKPYLEGHSRFGTLLECASRLLNCKEFIGCDSGMSHLAGALGVGQNVYIKGSCYNCLNRYYENSYTNCVTHRMNMAVFL